MNLSLEQAIAKLPHFVGGPDDTISAEIAILAGNPRLATKVLTRDKAHFRRLLEDVLEIAPRNDFLPFLRQVLAEGIPIAIGSLTDRNVANTLLEKSGLRNEIGSAPVMLREDVNELKPAPDVYMKTARLLGIPPSDQIVFEDSPNGVLAGRSAGNTVIAVPTISDPVLYQRLHGAGASIVLRGWDGLDWSDVQTSMQQGETRNAKQG